MDLVVFKRLANADSVKSGLIAQPVTSLSIQILDRVDCGSDSWGFELGNSSKPPGSIFSCKKDPL